MLDGSIAGAVDERAHLRDVEPAPPAARVLGREPRDEAHRRGSASGRIGRGEDLAVRALRPVDLVLSVRQDDYLAAVDRWLAHFGVAAPAPARDADERTREALQLALQRGSRSGRVAWQFARALGRRARGAASAGEVADARATIVARRRGGDRAAPTATCCSRSARRARPYAGYWEFPGGKLEPGETPRACAGARAARGARHRRAHARRRGSCRNSSIRTRTSSSISSACCAWRRRAAGHDGQAFAWQDPHAIDVAPLLPANTRVLAALTLPAVYAITCASDLGDAAFVERRSGALAAGVRLIQVREPEPRIARRAAFRA